MEISELYRVWAQDAEVLGEVGAALHTQPTRLVVRLPESLAAKALVAWERESVEMLQGDETPEQRQTRHRAGTLGLIGLSVETTGVTEGGEVVVELDAWHIGDALNAADDEGLL